MKKPANNRKKIKTTGLLNKSIGYSLPENPVEFYVREATSVYGKISKTAEELLELEETRELLDNYGDAYLIEKKKKDLAKTCNYKKGVFYHATGGLGESGLGKALYLGKDRRALNNFYNLDGTEGCIEMYLGNPLFIDLALYDEFDKFESTAKEKYPNAKYNAHLRLLTLALGYDGIRYYDPIATGEEFVLYNTDKVVPQKN